METHFSKNGPPADYTGLLIAVAAGFFTAEERGALQTKAGKLADVLARIAEFEAEGPRSLETFKKRQAAVSADETLDIDRRIDELEILREEHAKMPQRMGALSAIADRYHADFVEPANRLARHFLPRLKEQIAAARTTEIELAQSYGLPIERLTGALFEPLVRAHDSLFSETFGLGGSLSFLERAGVFLIPDAAAAAASDELAIDPAKKILPGMTRRGPVPRGMGAPA